jgi:hypothetical protein
VRGNQQGYPRGAVGGSLGCSLRRRIDAFVWVAGNCVEHDVPGGMAEAGFRIPTGHVDDASKSANVETARRFDDRRRTLEIFLGSFKRHIDSSTSA